MDVFTDIVGQEKAVSFLRNALKNGNVSHAYLFTGPDGVGKRMAAGLFAVSLLCGEGGCGVCGSCRKALAGAHPDIEVISPDGKTLKIEQIRKISGSIGYKPFEGARRIYVIEEAHAMTAEAANALLKSLEEPPAHVVFVLTAAGTDSLLPTIVSRCQEIPYGTIKSTVVRDYLTAMGVDEVAASAAAGLSAGSLSRAIEISAPGAGNDIRTLLLDRINDLRTGGLVNLFAVKDEVMGMVKAQEKQGNASAAVRVVDLLASWYRDVIVYAETGNTELLHNKDRSDSIVNATVDKKKAAAVLASLVETGAAMRTNASKELLLEHAFLTVNGA